MRPTLKSVALVGLVLLVGAACRGAEDEIVGEPFSLTGRVVSVQQGVRPPSGVIEERDDDGIDLDGDDEGRSRTQGSLLIRVEDPDDADDLEGCVTENGDFTVYFTSDTAFDPSGTVGDDDFPDVLVDASVEIDGTFYREDATIDAPIDTGATPRGDCVLVADRVDVEDAGTVGGAPPAGTPTPAPTPTPTPTGTPDDDEASPTPTAIVDEGTDADEAEPE